jgi:hypothetical protein
MQDFPSGLIRAGNAQIIKGDRAQACIPPLLTLYKAEQSRYSQYPQEFEDDVDEIGSATLDYEIESQWSGGTSHSEDLAEMEIDPTCDPRFLSNNGSLRTTDVSFRPHFVDDSYSPTSEECAPSEPVPDEDPVSSPLGPITPFGVFVDRVVASHFAGPKAALPITAPFDPNSIHYGAPPPAATLQYEVVEQQLAVPPTPDVMSMPSATLSYKKIADPLAEWVASFVWKVCTTGLCLHTQYTYVYATSHPST